MEDSDFVPSRAAAGDMAAQGFAGMLVPSFFVGASERHVNLILWRWGDDLPVLVRVYGLSGRLPKDRKSSE